jgi:beta-galactosidase
MQEGSLLYLGAWPDDDGWQRILAERCSEVGLDTLSLPDGLRLRDTAKHRFAFNYGPTEVMFNDCKIAPAGVAWWKL